MYDVNELWSSPWRDLQQNLAIELNAGCDCVPGSNAGVEFREGRMHANSWLGRARRPSRPQAGRTRLL
jgi:hypothetical protein